MFSLDTRVAEARASAAAGHGVVEILEEIQHGLGSDFSQFRFIFVLKTAFDVPVRNLKEITSWNQLSDSGLMTTAEVVDLARPWLAAAGADSGSGHLPE